MTLFKRLLKKDTTAEELPCPRCGIPVPTHTVDCTACGWDVRDGYSGADAGSYVAAARGD